ncbi:hypothetical protein ACO0LC_01580 [Undibacterium sp. JH2W]|uniref:hypothetical protein n=1 Tax=Undibacterium sp. JH2W TaxID=3413037 RepID=UPI003BEF59C1
MKKSDLFVGKAKDKVRNILEIFSVASAFYWYPRSQKARMERNYLHLYSAGNLLIFYAENYTCPSRQLTKFCSRFSRFLHGNIILLTNDSLAKIPSGLMLSIRKKIFNAAD